MKHVNISIIGGGVSGLAAAVASAQSGAQVTVFEKNDRVGKKLLATGNGRCNLANTGKPVYFGDSGFALETLKALPVEEVLHFLETLGLPCRAEESGRVYPACNQAAAVLDVMRFHLEKNGVTIRTGCTVSAIRKKDQDFLLQTSQGSFTADKVIVCCGGSAAPKLGGTDATGLLTALDCRLVPQAPALMPLETEKAPIKGLSGLRLFAVLTLCDGKTPVERTAGEVLFADYGISGVCAMQLGRTAEMLLRQGKIPILYLDFSPAMGLIPAVMERQAPASPKVHEETVRRALQRRLQRLGSENLLLGALPRVLREKLNTVPMELLPRMLCAYPLKVTGTRGFDQAQVTAGGVDCRDFDPHTMECRHCPGLYACGEILNVDGDCGGFNIQFALAGGLLAAAHATH